MAVTRIKNNQITDATIVASSKLLDFSISAAKIANNLTYGSNLTITGNLTVQGNTTAIDTNITTIEDPVILLASTQTGNAAVDIGFIGQRGLQTNIAFVWDESQGVFVTAFTDTAETATTLNITAYASTKVLNSQVTGNLAVTGLSNIANLTVAANSSVSFGSNKISNVADPVGAQDAATKAYVDSELSSSDFSITDGTTTQSIIGGDTIEFEGSTNITLAVANVSNVISSVTATLTNDVTITGNLGAGTVSSTGTVTGGNVATGGTVSATGNITGGNVATGGAISAAATITGGNLATGGTVSSTGTATLGNVATGGTVSATGNITGGNLATGGAISSTGTITGGNLATGGTISSTGTATLGNVATNGTVSATSSITGGSIATGGTVSATSTITSAATITGGNLATGGTVSSTGTATLGNVATGGTVSAAGTITGGNVSAGSGFISTTGNVVAGNVNTTSIVGATVTVTSAGAITLAGNTIDASSTRIINLATPTGANDAANKEYVDSVAQGLNIKASVRVATTDALPAYTYNNGTAGVGATITASAVGALVVDGQTLTVVGTRVLVKDDVGDVSVANSAYNRIYTLTTVGTVSVAFVLTRSLDMNIAAEFDGAFTFVSVGAEYADTGWVQTGEIVTVGTTPVVWTQFSGAGQYQAGNGLALTGTVFSVNVDETTTTITGDAVVVKVGAQFVTPNIGAATGTSLSVTGTITGDGTVTGGNIATAGTISSTGTATLGNVNTGGAISAAGTATAGNLATGGTVSATGTATLGNVATGGTISAASSITGGSIATAGTISATGSITSATTITGGNLATGGTVSSTGTATVGNLATGGTVSATGNITGGNISTAGTFEAASLSASGNITGGNLLTGGLISATSTITSAATITGGNLATGGTVSSTGTATLGNVATGGTVSSTGTATLGNVATGGTVSAAGTATAGNIATGGTVSSTGTATLGNVATGGTVSATGNITGGNITTAGTSRLGNIVISGDDITDTNGRVNFNTAGGDVDFAVNGDTVANVFYVDAGTGTTSFGSATQTTGAIIAMNTSTSFLMPVGNIGQRPATGVTGMLRFNSQENYVEVFDNTAWAAVAAPPITVVTDDQFSGDGSNVAFTLSVASTTAGTIVSINGVVQIPTTAYSVSGTTLTFTEAPATGDAIDSRVFTTTSSVTQIENGNSAIEIPTSNGNIVLASNGATVLTVSPGLVDIQGNLTVSGNATLSGNILGDRIQNGTTSLDIQTAGGNANITIGATSNVAVFTTAGLNITGTVSANGTVTGGNLATGGTVSATATITGGNIATGGTVSSTGTATLGNVATGGTVSATGNITGGNLLISGSISDSAQLDIQTTASNANIVLTPNGTGNVNFGSNIMPTANATANIGSATLSFNTVFAKATSAQYADLAEKYAADAVYAPGTVVSFGGDAEVTASTDADSRVAGVVSTNPSYIMNSGLQAEHAVTVALTGRVPTRVTGTVRKGDLMVSAGNGLARAEAAPAPGTIIGKALANHDGAEGAIEVVVGRF